MEIPTDELVTWKELVEDGRLAEALEMCEEEGWEALPLAPEKAERTLPGGVGNAEGRGEMARE